MLRPRNVAYLLLGLDGGAFLVIFNSIRQVRGVASGWVIEPLLLPVAAFIFAIYLIQGYRARTDMLSIDYASQHAIATIGAMLATLLLTYAFAMPGSELAPQSSRLVIAFSFLAMVPLSLGYRRIVYLRLAAHRERRMIVFLGDRASCETFRDECEKMGMAQGVVYSFGKPGELAPSRAPGEIAARPFPDILADIQEHRIAVEAIVLRESARELEPEISRQLVKLYFAGVPTYTLELFHQVYWQKIPLYRLNQTWLFQEGFQIAREPVFERLKRVSDVTLSILGLILFSIPLALGAFAVWLEDRSSPLFVQSRVGKNHLPFPLYKLRTMRRAPAVEDLYTQPGDARITRVGRILRNTRLDELPQLWNVLRGDMSLIGPRAEWDRLVETYERQIPCYHFRHLVKPGITGWAQVNYPYGASMEDTTRKLEYDLYYIRHFSFLLDATIVLKTIHVMLFGKGR